MVSEAPAAQTTDMAVSPQPVLEQESIPSAVPAAANNLDAATADEEVSDIPATGEPATDGIEETVIDIAASITPVEEGVVESAVTEAAVSDAATAANGEADILAPSADIIVNIVATDATVVQTVPSSVPVIEGQIAETLNEATPNEVVVEAAVITATATGEDGLLLDSDSRFCKFHIYRMCEMNKHIFLC